MCLLLNIFIYRTTSSVVLVYYTVLKYPTVKMMRLSNTNANTKQFHYININNNNNNSKVYAVWLKIILYSIYMLLRKLLTAAGGSVGNVKAHRNYIMTLLSYVILSSLSVLMIFRYFQHSHSASDEQLRGNTGVGDLAATKAL